MLGIIAQAGSLNGQRVAIIDELVRVDQDDPSAAKLQNRAVPRAAALAEDEILVLGTSFKPWELGAAGFDRHVVRLAKNLTAHRNVLPFHKGQGRRPEYGDWRLLCLRSPLNHLS